MVQKRVDECLHFRALPLGKLRAIALCSLLCLTLLGCSKSLKSPLGWITLDVPQGVLPTGWTVIKDDETGASIAIPPSWKQMDPGNQAQQAELQELVSRVAPRPDRHSVGFVTQGMMPALLAVDESKEGLQPLGFTTLMLLHTQPGSGSLDRVESGLRKKSMPDIHRVELPIGPALEATRANGNSKVVMIMVIHADDAYMIRINVPSERLAALQPLIDQMANTLRFTKPNPNAPHRQAPPVQTDNGFGGFGGVPNGPASTGQIDPNPPATPQQPQDQTPAEPAPGPGMPGHAPGDQSGNPQGDSSQGGTGGDPNASGGGSPGNQ